MKKSLFKKITAFLISSVLILLNTTFPICAYDTSTSEDDTVLEMVQDTDGSYYCIIPCEIEIYSDNTNLVPTPYADCSKQFTGKIEARYYLESHDLTMSIIIKRKWGTGLLKSITGQIDFSQFSSDGHLFPRNPDDSYVNVEENLRKPLTQISAGNTVGGVVASQGDSFKFSANGTFLLVDGYGAFHAEATYKYIEIN